MNVEFLLQLQKILCGDELTWVEGNNGYVPSEAVSAGVQANGEPLYVGRARICGSLVTGKILPSHNCIYVPFDGVEHSITQYEVLVSQQRRKFSRRNSISNRAYHSRFNSKQLTKVFYFNYEIF